MDLAHLYSDVLKTLGDALVRMTAPQWDQMMQASTAEQRQRATQLILQTQEARLTLANATLNDILDQLRENEADLEKGVGELRTALERFDSFDNMLSGLTSVISVVAKVVPLAA